MTLSSKIIKNLTTDEYLKNRQEIKSFYIHQREKEVRDYYNLIKDNAKKVHRYKLKRICCLEICEYSNFCWYILHYKKGIIYFKKLLELIFYLEDNNLSMKNFKLEVKDV